MATRRTIAGSCLCGAIRIEVTGSFRNVTNCHCRMCQKANGAPVVPWVTVARENYRIVQGTPAGYRSSAKAERTFCRDCGSHLTFAEDGRPDQLDVVVAVLDDAASLAPVKHIWVDSRMPWHDIDDGLPRFAQDAPGE